MRGTVCKEWEEGQSESREEGRESSRRLGGEKRAASPCKQGEREEHLLVICQSEWVRVREKRLVHI